MSIYASNPDLCTSSVLLELELMNMKFSEGSKTVFIVPAKSERFKIGDLTSAAPGAAKYTYKYKTALGDVTLKTYDQSFVYDLPFAKEAAFRIAQGYNGSFSHQNEKALDFTMPEGTEIRAAREGLVVQVVQNNATACGQEECKKYNNYVTIMHSDGSFTHYAHIRYNGSTVKIGDQVKKGDLIAYSGNVGWSAGPHLHFVSFLGGFDKWRTLETKFRIDDGSKLTTLQEGTVYSRRY